MLVQKAFLMHQPFGQGHVIAFAEDANYRAFAEAIDVAVHERGAARAGLLVSQSRSRSTERSQNGRKHGERSNLDAEDTRYAHDYGDDITWE